jgi:hypothetical protein
MRLGVRVRVCIENEVENEVEGGVDNWRVKVELAV